MNSSIEKYVSRYVVPFYFDYEHDGYKRIRDSFLTGGMEYPKDLKLPGDGQWVSAGFWENYKAGNGKQAEMDLYSYLPSIFLEDRNAKKKEESNLGVSLVFKTNGNLLELMYVSKDKEITFSCTNLGVLIFKNGIGFIWYETEFKDPVSIDDYVGFQHDFKELARVHGKKFLLKNGYDKDAKKPIYEPFCFGIWLSKVVSAEKLGIEFWAERETKTDGGIPDKALLFQYLFVKQITDREIENLTFRVANGYDEQYNALTDMSEQFYRPFENVNFYVSKAGMACVVKDADTNEEFFKGQFSEKFIRDYFFIYLLLSYQSYSCARYSWLLTKLPADEKAFEKKSIYVDKLESLNGQINLFLVKSVFASVSNIQHQNGVYRYGKSTLCIEEDVQSLTVGLDALKDMEKEKRDRKVDLAITVFGAMIIVSAWIDGLNLIDWFMKNSARINLGHGLISLFIVVLTVLLIYVLVKNRRK